jgi:hypothetical protein
MLEKFMEWLNSEIDGLKQSRDNVYLSGKLAEAIRICQTICDMDVKSPGIDREDLETAMGKICKHYCKFPEAYPENEHERMVEEKCMKCPLWRVME